MGGAAGSVAGGAVGSVAGSTAGGVTGGAAGAGVAGVAGGVTGGTAGAAGSAGSLIDLATAEQISRGFVGITQGKHKLVWRGAAGYVPKDKVKLLLNLIACSVTALPRGGEIDVAVGGSFETPSFLIRCKGTGARPPQYLTEFITGNAQALDAMSIQAYYTWRIAQSADMAIEILKDGADILLVAKPSA